MRKKRRINVRKHKRRLKSGNISIVKSHRRNIKRRTLKNLHEIKENPFTKEVKAKLLNDLTSAAIKTFGTTDDPLKAFWILNDGQMLSGVYDAQFSRQRDIDHTAISQATMDLEEQYPLNTLGPEYNRLAGLDSRKVFQTFANAIRYHVQKHRSGSVDFNIDLTTNQKPTKEQWNTLLNNLTYYYETGSIYYDISKIGEGLAANGEIEIITPKRAIRDLKKVFIEHKDTPFDNNLDFIIQENPKIVLLSQESEKLRKNYMDLSLDERDRNRDIFEKYLDADHKRYNAQDKLRRELKAEYDLIGCIKFEKKYKYLVSPF